MYFCEGLSHVCRHVQRPEEGIKYPWTGAAGTYESPAKDTGDQTTATFLQTNLCTSLHTPCIWSTYKHRETTERVASDVSNGLLSGRTGVQHDLGFLLFVWIIQILPAECMVRLHSERWKQVDPWNSLTTKPNISSESQDNERPCVKRQGGCQPSLTIWDCGLA